jgi:hypothetical protein
MFSGVRSQPSPLNCMLSVLQNEGLKLNYVSAPADCVISLSGHADYRGLMIGKILPLANNPFHTQILLPQTDEEPGT